MSSLLKENRVRSKYFANIDSDFLEQREVKAMKEEEVARSQASVMIKYCS